MADYDALYAALRKKRAEDCPICGDPDTAIPAAPTFIPIPGVVPIGTDDPNPREGIEAVVVTCTNCGFIRMHDLLELLGDD